VPRRSIPGGCPWGQAVPNRQPFGEPEALPGGRHNGRRGAPTCPTGWKRPAGRPKAAASTGWPPQSPRGTPTGASLGLTVLPGGRSVEKREGSRCSPPAVNALGRFVASAPRRVLDGEWVAALSPVPPCSPPSWATARWPTFCRQKYWPVLRKPKRRPSSGAHFPTSYRRALRGRPAHSV